jgi:hypothetical protein
MKPARIMLLAVYLILVSLGCSSGGGGGGDNSTPTDPNIPFQLFPSGYFSQGYSENYDLTGSDTAGGTHTGSLSLSTQAATIFDGQSAIPVSQLLSFTNTQTNAFLSVSVTGYYSNNANDRKWIGEDQITFGVINSATTTYTLPETATIGDFGNVGSYTGSDGTGMVVTWQLTNANNGLANIVINFTYYDSPGGAISGSEEQTYTINQSGERQRFKIRADVGGGVTITLSGPKV